MSIQPLSVYLSVPAFSFVLLFGSKEVLAHHPMGHMMPESFWQGLLSGLGHPVIGLDHLVFLLALGLLTGLHNKFSVWPLFFFLATSVLGALVSASGLSLPLIELGVAMSVVLIGSALAAGWVGRWMALVLWAATAGLFHGLAYGEAIIGAEPAPIMAYLLGFLIIQSAIVSGVAYLVRALRRTSRSGLVVTGSRYCGAVVGFTGAVFAILVLGG